MKAYNGFSALQRNKAQSWLNKQWSVGKLQRPAQCCSCKITEGIIDAHAEDYSEPFTAGKTDQYHLCYRCHLMLHCRFANPKNFAHYCQMVYEGTQYRPFYQRNWVQFSKECLGEFNAPVYGVSMETTNILASIHANLSTKQ